MNKVGRYKQLESVADPEILVLFEEWLEEIEGEVVRCVAEDGEADPSAISRRTGLSAAGAKFIVTKLRREEKI